MEELTACRKSHEILSNLVTILDHNEVETGELRYTYECFETILTHDVMKQYTLKW